MTNIRNGQALFRFGDGYRVVRCFLRREFELECLSTGKRSIHSQSELAREASAGALTGAPTMQRQLLASVLLGIAHGPLGVPRTQRWSQEIRRLHYIQRLVAQRSFDKPWIALGDDVWRISQERREKGPPHASTVRRWRALYREAERFSRTVLGRTRSTEVRRNRSERAVAVDGLKPLLRVVR